ncbi:EAL domain-containing protein [Psychromonas ossibalaenae]|uniref:EAL domain-containing protein n=1 Tax=Psychromonas ossibalaenae TaxID=444922 RepID=UPI0003743ED3|nr:EAL domain-containing protein [Psychromonas ossibalaenae]
MKFASKITLSVALVSLVALPMLVLSVFYSARTVLQKNISQTHQEIAQRQMQTIDRALYTAYRDIQMIAEDDFLQVFLARNSKANEKEQLQILNELEERALFTGPWDLLTVVDEAGYIIMSTNKELIGRQIEEYTTSSTAYYQAVKGKTYYSDLVLSQESGRPTVIFAAPVKSRQGKSAVNGVVLGHFAWPVIIQALDEIPPPAVVHLINKTGMTIAAPSAYADHIFKLNLDGHALAEKSLADGIGGSAVIEQGAHKVLGPMLAVYSSQNGLFGYKGRGWGLLLEAPLEKALAPVNQLARNVAAAALIVTILLIGVLYYAGRMLARPVEKLTETVEEVSRGDLTVKAEVSTTDEVGELACSFNRMTETLQKTTVSKDYLDNILKTMLNMLIVIDPDRNIISVNQAALSLLGYQENELIGRPAEIIIAEKSLLKSKNIAAFALKGTAANLETYYISKNGRRITVLFSSSIMHDSEGQVKGIVCAATDISKRKEHEEKLRRNSRALRAIHASHILLTRSDNEHSLFAGVCSNIVDQTGYRFAWVGLLHPDNADSMITASCAGEEQHFSRLLQQRLQAVESADSPEATALRTCRPCIEININNLIENVHWRREAAEYGYRSVIVLPLMHKQEAFGVLSIYSLQNNSFEADEVTLMKKLADDLAYGVTAIRTKQNHKLAEKKIAYQAFHDSLTGLPNRAKIMQSLKQSVEHIHKHNGALAILFIDLDDFKLVNDTLGHSAGDELLQQAAKRLKRATRDSDIVARQGGDEFIVLFTEYDKQLTNTEFEQEASVVAQRILDDLHKPFRVQDQDAYISASIGISLLPGDSDNADQLIQYADNAMYRAKELGRNNYQYYSQELSERQQKKMSLATMLHKAVEQKEFRLLYQPLINLDNGRMVGVEALIRWERETSHLISPADFLPVAEDTGLILPIGDWVIQEACQQLRKWADKGISLQVAVNLSARQMWHGDIAGQILNIINETGISKSMLEIEVTESAMFVDPERMEKTLLHFKDNGIKISLDDFGTGYSSLNRLKRLPIHKLKIDKSFVDGTPEDEDDIAIVTATIQMAQSLKLYSLAEGIETLEQCSFLKGLGCNYGQGYYFSKPVPAAEIELMFNQNHQWELQIQKSNNIISMKTS